MYTYTYACGVHLIVCIIAQRRNGVTEMLAYSLLLRAYIWLSCLCAYNLWPRHTKKTHAMRIMHHIYIYWHIYAPYINENSCQRIYRKIILWCEKFRLKFEQETTMRVELFFTNLSSQFCYIWIILSLRGKAFSYMVYIWEACVSFIWIYSWFFKKKTCKCILFK